MSVRHFNENTRKIELVDRPVPDCACKGCSRARRGQSQSRGRRSFPPDNATISGQQGYAKQTGDRTQAWWGPDKESEIATNDGLNASYVREDGIDIVDEAQSEPYKPHKHRRR